jgi:regulator of replication initiation timing
MSETEGLHTKVMGFLGGEFARKDGRQCTGVDLLYAPGGGFKDEEIRKWSRPDEPELFDVPGNLVLVESFITKIIEIAENEADAKPPGKHRFILRTHQHLGGRATMSFSMSPSFRGGGDETTALVGLSGGRGDQAVMAQFASQAMRINAGMFDGTLRVLAGQNNDLRTENGGLRTENFQLRRELEELRTNRDDRQFQLAMAAAKNERQDEVFKRLMDVGQLVMAKMSGFEGAPPGGTEPAGDGASDEAPPLTVLLEVFGKSLRPEQIGVLMNTLDADQKGLFMRIMRMARSTASQTEAKPPGHPAGASA